MHIEKETLIECRCKIGHDLRQHNHYKNEDVDITKSHLNYSFHIGNPFKKLNDRIKDIYIYGKDGKNKDKINYICSVCVHYHEEFGIPETEFFTIMHDVLAEKFGVKNVISSTVHKDEKGLPHLHFKFMPVIWNEQKKREELCAKKVVNRSMLQTFHKDIEKLILEMHGYKIKLHDPEKVKTEVIEDMETYKALQEELNKTKNENDLLKNENDLLKNRNAELVKRNQYLAQKNKEFGASFENASLDEIISIGRSF